MSNNLSNSIPESDLPVKKPSGAARIRYVDGDGKSYSSAMPDVTAAAALVQDAIDGIAADAEQYLGEVVSDAQAEINAIVAGLGYLPPVPFTSGINVDSGRVTVEYGGTVYAPVMSEVPFTTTGTFDPDQWRVIQGVTAADLASGDGAWTVGYQLDAVGSVVRSLGDKDGDSVNLLDFYGVDTSGVTDSTAAFQAAIDYVSSTGKILNLPPGTIKVGEVNLSSPIHIRGAGQDKTKIFATGSYFLRSSSSVNPLYSRFSDFTLIGLGRDKTADQTGFDIVACGGIIRCVTFERVWIEGFSLYGVAMTDSINPIFRDSRIRSCGAKTAASGGPRGAGVYMYSGPVLSGDNACIIPVFDNCTFGGCSYGVLTPSGELLTYPTFSDCSFQSCIVGIDAQKSVEARLVNCYFESNGEKGAKLRDGYAIGCRNRTESNPQPEDDIVFSRWGLVETNYSRASSYIGRTGSPVYSRPNGGHGVPTLMAVESGGLKVIEAGRDPASPNPGLYAGAGSPDGLVYAGTGSIYMQHDGTASGGVLWAKRTASGSASGWRRVYTQESGSAANRPASMYQNGVMYWNTTTGKPNFWNDSANKWVHADGSDA